MTIATSSTGSAERWGPLWGAHPRDWAASEEQQIPTYEAAIHHAEMAAGQRILEIGCGSGVFLRAAADRGAHVVGIDASAALIKVAQMRVPEAELAVGDMQFLPDADDAFDAVAGFNSFFFAADMVAALREAGRVAKPGAPIVIQVWGQPTRCDLTAMKSALAELLPAPDAQGPPPPALWETGVLERIATEAGLAPTEVFDISWAYEFPSESTLAHAMLAPGMIVELVRILGEAAVRTAIIESLAPYRSSNGRYRLQNEWHTLIARA
jgi:SAM-dependent methyltransferase